MTDKREQNEANAAINRLESGEGDELSLLGTLVRETAQCRLPESSSELEDLLLDELTRTDQSNVRANAAASQGNLLNGKGPLSSKGPVRTRWILAATVLVAASAFAIYQLTELNSAPESTADLDGDMVASGDITGGTGVLRGHSILDDMSNHPPSTSSSIIGQSPQSVFPSSRRHESVDELSVAGEWSRNDRFSVQLPELSGQTTNYSVTVPDGGTVLMGGIKREGFGVNTWHAGSANHFYRLSAPASARHRSYFEPLGETRLGLELDSYHLHLADEAERSTSEQYNALPENDFYRPLGDAAISTFSIDVDTGAYSNMRRYVNGGRLPPPDAVRIEELVNYFDYQYEQPRGDDPFSVNMELASCPWNEEHRLLRIGLKGKEVHFNERPPTNVVFLIDVSGSMDSPDKLPLLKRGFQMMVDRLNENDRVSIVTYAGNAGVVLEPTSGDRKREIQNAIEVLSPGGSTHGSAGIELAYQLAQQNFITDGANKVILATDGDLNVGITEDSALVDLITQKASEGVFLTVLGFGTGNLKDGKMEQLADNGNGAYSYIDNIREARKVLVEEMSGSLVTIAKDVKIQVEFNPAEVTAYRLIGYENRMMAAEDFDDDTKDAGEIGAGHTVTALYEIVPAGTEEDARVHVPEGMRYQLATPSVQQPAAQEDSPELNLADAASSGELCTLSLRYKQPDENESRKLDFTIDNEDRSFSTASTDFRFAASVASLGMMLRGSRYGGASNPALVEEIAASALGEDRSGYRAEFVDLVRQVRRICEQ